MKELENKLFANELALKNLENSKRLMNLADDDLDYLQAKHNIEMEFEMNKLEYKEITGTDYINMLINMNNENLKSNHKQYKKELKLNWKEICNNYLFEFCNKHEYTYEPDCWIAGDPGTIVNIGDMFVSMENIRYDIDNDVPEEYFERWYWKSLEVYELTEQNYINYENYCKGCPDPWPESRLSSVRAAKQRVIDAQKELEEEINRYKDEN